jgi:hypothetical protein
MTSFKKILFCFLFFSLLSCAQGKLDPLDRDAGLTIDEFNGSLIKDREKERFEKSDIETEKVPVPNISKLSLIAPPKKIGGDKIISFSVTDQVPLKDVLIELGRVAKIDVDIDQNITGGIILTAKNRPLKEVIDRIAVLGGIRYSYTNDVLRFEKDSPYMKNYFVDFLSGSQLWGDVESNLNSILTDSSAPISDSNASSSASKISSNKSAGIISVYATNTQHDRISKYLDDVFKISSAQVLIEAKVVEVTLNKEYSAGIDWNWVEAGKSVSTSFGSPSSPSISAIVPKVKLLGLGGNISATIKALEKFGTARAISSPRVSAINNQKATLDFTQNYVYFTISSNTSTIANGNGNPTTVAAVTATKNEVPIGVQLSITPSINLETDEVTLTINPKLSVKTGEALDPSVDQEGNSLGNKVPIISTRQIDTIAKVQSGSVLVVGGLMTEAADNTDVGVPLLYKFPILGNLFKYTSKTNNIVETVIFVKATIVKNSSLQKYDRDFYNNFTTDRKSFL